MTKLFNNIFYSLLFTSVHYSANATLNPDLPNPSVLAQCTTCTATRFPDEQFHDNDSYVRAASSVVGIQLAANQSENNDGISKQKKPVDKKVMKTASTDLDNAERAMENGDFDTASKLSKKLAEDGNARAQYIYGRLFVLKFMLENYGKDYNQELEAKEKNSNKQSLIWLTKAAEQNYAVAQGALGMMYAEGQGVPADPILGHMWIILSAQGDKEMLEEARSSAERNYDMTDEEFNQALQMADKWKQAR